jgi:hypothetical protein
MKSILFICFFPAGEVFRGFLEAPDFNLAGFSFAPPGNFMFLSSLVVLMVELTTTLSGEAGNFLGSFLPLPLVISWPTIERFSPDCGFSIYSYV